MPKNQPSAESQAETWVRSRDGQAALKQASERSARCVEALQQARELDPEVVKRPVTV